MKVAKGETTLRFEVPDGEGAVILYKRCPRPLYEDLRKAHIADERTGRPDIGEMTLDIAPRCAVGWENVTELDTGEPLPFSTEHFLLLDDETRLLIGFAATEHIHKITTERVREMLRLGQKKLMAEWGTATGEKTDPPKTEEPELTVPLPDSSVSPTT
ncbi:hypothetical protein M0R72_10875 [Candidatus Pacearchaeota archaeon]|jgi:hypothetical protein|nr:hypothetical protein [Candidatus Pacearchaeota archaeon]